MKAPKLRAGVIGTGFIGPVHVEALRRLGVEVVALAGSSAERAAEKAEQLGISRSYGSAGEMLADPDVEIVHIASPNHLHFPHARAALLAGKHVICEKPLAMHPDESAQLVQLARESDLISAVNFNIRYYPISQHAREMVRGGELGEVYIVQGSYLQDWLLLPTDWNWRLEPMRGGRMRAVSDIGSHWIDLMSYITGLQVEAVLADFKTFLPVRRKPANNVEIPTHQTQTPGEYVEQAISTEDYAGVLFRYTGGARGMMSVSQVSAGRKNRIYYEIDGSQSSIAWDGEQPNELWIGHRNSANGLLLKDPTLLSPEGRRFAFYPAGQSEGFPDTFKALYHAIYSYIERGDLSAPRDFPTFEDGHREMLVAEAILLSSHEDRWVSVTSDQ
ncbi:MAG: Gfo/Idh/MocA family oxidoreductase [Chloroflexota bacterium]|nr:Gfo/Idh/MocA family oxidoreductase [Chloroflexota bacterium]